jgi:RimJ/RimL family protein N-acetyltransferase
VLAGERVTLRPTGEADLPDLMRLWNTGAVMRWVGFPDGLGIGADGMRRWHERLRQSPERRHFTVRAPKGAFCGEAFYAVEPEHQRAGLDIKLLPEAQGHGYATDALRTLIAHIFASEPAIDAVWTEPAAANLAAQRLYARCGLAPSARPVDLGAGESYWELRRE